MFTHTHTHTHTHIHTHTLITSLSFQRHPFGRQEWDQFQMALGPTYHLCVISSDFYNVIMYEGPHKAKNKLYVYHVDGHYNAIISMTAFVDRSYYCDNCHMGYDNRGIHACKPGCMYPPI